MLQELANRDPILKFLLENSSFSRVQLDTYLSNKAKGYMTLSDRVSLLDRGSISKGSYLRSLRQAQQNLLRSIFTVFIAEYLGLIEVGTITGLLKAGEMLAAAREKRLSADQAERLISALRSISRSISK